MDTQQQAINTVETQLLLEHKGLLHKFSKACFSRLRSTGVTSVDYEDVFQIMAMSLVKAHRSFDPGKGITFTAYMGRSCYNNFNKVAERLIREQIGDWVPEVLKDEEGANDEGDSPFMIRGRDMRQTSPGLGTMRECDMSRADEDEGDMFGYIYEDEANGDSPEAIIERAQEFRLRAQKLTKPAKRFLLTFLEPPADLREQFEQEIRDAIEARANGEKVWIKQDITFARVGKYLKMDRQKMRDIRQELQRVFEVRF